MITRNQAKHDPTYNLEHFLIEKLSAMVGQCQLLREDLPKDVPQYPHCLERLLAIQDTANAMVEEIKANHDCLGSLKKAGWKQRRADHEPVAH
jgi:hypothetical protein